MKAMLNLDIPGKISEFESLLKKVLPKNVSWTAVLSRGLEFDGFRDYSGSEDASNIDWKASKRSNKLLIKKYIEEKDRKFLFLIDTSENMVFGSTEKLKCEYAGELSAALCHRIISDGDRVGFVFYNNTVIKTRPPELGNRQFDIFVNELSNPKNYFGSSDLNKVLEIFLSQIDPSTNMIFIVSDFLKIDDDYKKNLNILGGMFETVAIIINDPLDFSLPDIDKEIVIENPSTGEKLLINPSIAKKIYEQQAKMHSDYLKKIFSDANIDFLELSTNENSSLSLAQFLAERIRYGGGR